MTTAVFDYLEYWGLETNAFSLAPCPSNLFFSKQHRECLLRLQYAILAGKGGALLISENAGDGKTTVLRRLCQELDKQFDGQVRIAFIDHPTLTPTEMIDEIMRQLGIPNPDSSKARALSQLRAHLLDLRARGIRCVVIVDEGQMLAHQPELLQELRILLNFCVSDAFLLSFILSGQRPLEGAIRGMPEFWQRLPVRFFLANLDFRDTRELIRHRLRNAGLPEGKEIFTPAAYQQIYKDTEGCPRVICSLADLALVVGRSLRVQEIDASEVMRATADMEKNSSENYHYYHFLRSVGEKEEEEPEGFDSPEPEPQARCLYDELWEEMNK